MKNEKLYEKSIEEIVNYFVNINPEESLRYQLFDIGTLLIRNDAVGERVKKWKNNIYRYLEREQETFFPLISGPDGYQDNLIKTSSERISDLMGTMFDWIGRYLLMMGKATLEPDQHEFYTQELSGALGITQQDIVKFLALKYNQTVLPEDENLVLRNIEWDSFNCYYSIAQFHYSVWDENAILEENPLYQLK